MLEQHRGNLSYCCAPHDAPIGDPLDLRPITLDVDCSLSCLGMLKRDPEGAHHSDGGGFIPQHGGVVVEGRGLEETPRNQKEAPRLPSSPHFAAVYEG